MQSARILQWDIFTRRWYALFFFLNEKKASRFFWIFWQIFLQLVKQTFQLLKFFTIFNMFQLGCLEDVELPEKKELFYCSTFSNLQVCQQAGGNDPQQQLVEGRRRVFQWAPGALH